MTIRQPYSVKQLGLGTGLVGKRRVALGLVGAGRTLGGPGDGCLDKRATAQTQDIALAPTYVGPLLIRPKSGMGRGSCQGPWRGACSFFAVLQTSDDRCTGRQRTAQVLQLVPETAGVGRPTKQPQIGCTHEGRIRQPVEVRAWH